MNESLRGRTVLITGAARGIGAETARSLHSLGARLVLTDLDREPLSALAAELGSDVVTVHADVGDQVSMQDAVAEGVARFGGLDVVVANAGVVSYGAVMTVDPEEFQRLNRELMQLEMQRRSLRSEA